MHIFLNISADLMIIQIAWETITLERNDIEDTIWPVLVDLYNKYKFTDVFLLNWPGGFTNLRVWTLALNLLNSLQNWAFDIYSISKIDFFKYFVDKNILPKKWIIYIWQKKNVRLYDFTKWNYETIKKDEINYNDELFFDLVYEDWYFEKDWIKLSFWVEWNETKNLNKIILTYNWNDFETTIQDLNLQAEKIVQAQYFIKPIMWSQWQ